METTYKPRKHDLPPKVVSIGTPKKSKNWRSKRNFPFVHMMPKQAFENGEPTISVENEDSKDEIIE